VIHEECTFGSDTIFRTDVHTTGMSEEISVSDDVYRKLEREKGDRSISEVIRDLLEEDIRLADVTGTELLDAEVQEVIDVDIERMSREASSRLDDELL